MRSKLRLIERALRESGHIAEADEVCRSVLLGGKPVSDSTASLAAQIIRGSGKFSTKRGSRDPRAR